VTGDGTTDDTANFKTAVDTGLSLFVPDGTYIIDAGHNDNTKGIYLKNNQHIQLSRNAVIKVKTNALDSYELIRFDGVSNASISGGTLLGDRTTHTGGTGEYGMLIYIYDSQNITVSDMIIKDAWGDGIYLGGATEGEEPININIHNVRVDNCRRNNMSITAVIGMNVSDSYFTNANGTEPQSGIDIEPNAEQGITTDINMTNIVCSGNTSQGFVSTGQNVTVKNLIVHNNGANGLVVNIEANHIFDGVIAYDNVLNGIDMNFGGQVQLSNVTSYNNGQHGIGSEHIGSDTTIINAKTYNNAGDGIYLESGSAQRVSMIGCISRDNTLSGFNISVNYMGIKGGFAYNNTKNGIFAGSTNSVIEGVGVYNNGERGIRVYGSSFSRIIGNNIHSNSTTSAAGFDNLILENNSVNNTVIGNTIRQGSNSNKPRYGINLPSGSNNNKVAYNDNTGGGVTGDLNDAGTSNTVV
jgi:parallel beta-helix repeat protein